MKSLILSIALLGLASFGCSSDTPSTDTSSTAPSSAAPAAPAAAASGTPVQAQSATSDSQKLPPGIKPLKDGDDVAVLDTNLGQIILRFFPDKAPNHVKNFEKLAKSGFYDGTKFHRVIPHFMIQGGDPNSKGSDRSIMGTGGPGWSVKAEFNDVPFERGILGMARSSDPDSAGSQFFIMVEANPSLNNQYTVFGKVVKGMDVVDKIVNLPRDERDNPEPGHEAVLKSVKIVKWPIKS